VDGGASRERADPRVRPRDDVEGPEVRAVVELDHPGARRGDEGRDPVGVEAAARHLTIADAQLEGHVLDGQPDHQRARADAPDVGSARRVRPVRDDDAAMACVDARVREAVDDVLVSSRWMVAGASTGKTSGSKTMV